MTAALLTLRQRQILTLVSHGRPRKAIAAQMSLHPDTVKQEIGKAKRQLKARNAANLMLLALRAGLVSQ